MDVIVSHVNADFDSLGGLVGAGRLYPGAALVLPGGSQPNVRDFISLHREVLTVRTPAEIDPETITRVVVVDTASRRRLGAAAEWLDLPNVEVHLYDHHAEGDINASEARVVRWGSVSSLMAHLLRERGEPLTSMEATALLLGIYEDTGSLSYAGTAPEDLEAAAWLLRGGAELDVVAEFTKRSLTPEQRALLAELLTRTEVCEVSGVQIALAVASEGPYVEDAALLVHRLLDAQETAAAFLLAPMEGALYVIGRSRSDAVNVGTALRELGGGGHARAASATLRDAAPEEVRERLLKALEGSVSPEPTAREIMAYPVRTVRPDDSVAEARRRMIRYGHSGLVVMDDGKLAGVVTRRDVDKARHHHLEHAPVRGFMTREVHTVSPETPLHELERIMIGEGIGRLPVVRGGEIVGMVTRTDVLTALYGARYLAGTPPLAEEPAGQLARERLPASVQRLLEEIGQVAGREGAAAFVVGGFVRDLLLGERNLDVDILVEPDGIALARAFAAEAGGTVKVEGRFGTAKVTLPDGFRVDFATARTETYPHPGALPEVEPSSIVDDLRRRDFTINAMAMDLRPERYGALIDPFGGRGDLDRRRIRVLHTLSFIEDPTRLFRAVRFEERFHFRMDPQAEALARHAVETDALGRISPERLRAELYRTFREPKTVGALKRLEELGVLEWLAPDLELDVSLLQGIPGALEWWREAVGEPVDARMVWLAGLLEPLEDEALPIARDRLRLEPPNLRLVGQAIWAAADTERLFPEDTSPAETVRLLEPLPPEALVLLRAHSGVEARGERPRSVLDRFIREWRSVKLEITGEDLKALGYPPGPELGKALRATLEAKINGEVSGRDREVEYARRVLEGDGSQE